MRFVQKFKEANNMADADECVDITDTSSDGDDHPEKEFCLELQITRDSAGLLEKQKQKIETLFHVQIVDGELLQENTLQSTAKSTIQWYKLIGSEGDCKDAARYIRDLCNPKTTIEFLYDPDLSHVFDDSSLEHIERQTKAVVRRVDEGFIVVQGDEMNAVLADSLLYELKYGSSSSGCDNRLDSMLQQQLSCEDMETADGDVVKLSTEVKRALIITVSDMSSSGHASHLAPDVDRSGLRLKLSDSAFAGHVDPNAKEKEFEMLAKSKGYSEADAQAVIKQHRTWWGMTPKKFVRTLSTNRRRAVSDRSAVNSSIKFTNAALRDIETKNESQLNQIDLTEDTIVVSSESDYDSNDDDDDDVVDVKNQQESSAERGSSASKKSEKHQKQNKTQLAQLNESPPSSGETARNRVTQDANRMKNVVVAGDVPNWKAPSGDFTSADLFSGEMQKVVSCKDERRQVVEYSARSLSPLKPDANERPTSNSAQFVGGNYVAPGTSANHGDMARPFTDNAVRVHSVTADGNSVGYQPAAGSQHLVFGAKPKLRYIVIDGSNVAMHHGHGRYFSCRGIQLLVNIFRQKGHEKITAIVPQWRRQRSLSSQYPIENVELLENLKEEGFVAFSPSRRVGSRNITPYDDRFVLNLAIQTDGVVVSNDNYRDVYEEKQEFREVIRNRVLPFTVVGDIFLLPEDPLGRGGPTLEQFLSMSPTSSPPIHPTAVQQFLGDRFTIQNLGGPSAVKQPGQNGWIRPQIVGMQPDFSQWPSLPLRGGVPNPNYRPRVATGGIPNALWNR